MTKFVIFPFIDFLRIRLKKNNFALFVVVVNIADYIIFIRSFIPKSIQKSSKGSYSSILNARKFICGKFSGSYLDFVGKFIFFGSIVPFEFLLNLILSGGDISVFIYNFFVFLNPDRKTFALCKRKLVRI